LQVSLAFRFAFAILESLKRNTQTGDYKMAKQYGVCYTSAVTRNHQSSMYPTKLAAAKAAKALVYEGANNVRAYTYDKNIGAIDFDWKKVVRFI
jgi:hypothetical protein